MRKTCEKIHTDAAYRWFLGIPFGQKTPHFKAFSKNYERRFKDNDIFEKIFINIVEQAIEYGLVDGKELFTDSTHTKANANKKKFEVTVCEVVRKRRLWLEEEINEERKLQGRKEFVYKDKTTTKKIKVNTTDPDSGYYHRDNKENGFMYLDYRTVDSKANIIVDCHVTKGNVHDSSPYIGRLEYIKDTYGFNIERVALDSGFDSLDIKKYLLEENIFGVIGYRRYGTKESRRERRRYQYINDLNVYMNKATGEVLEYNGNINRDGYMLYTNLDKSEKILRHIKADLNDRYYQNRISTVGRNLYSLRKEKIERSFADSKQNHGFRYAMYHGLEKNQNYTWLICAAQNMKNIALKMNRYEANTQNKALCDLFFPKLTNIYELFKIYTKRKPLAFSN